MKPDGTEMGFLKGATLDLAYGADDGSDDSSQSGISGENDFELTAPSEYVLTKGARIIIDGTPYGGIVRKRKSDTADDNIVWSGQTWHGLLADRVISPPSGGDYLTVAGELNGIIDYIIDRLGLSSIFQIPSGGSGHSIGNYNFNRYIDGYNGLRKVCAIGGCRLNMVYDHTIGKIVISAVPIHDYSKDEELSSDLFSFTVDDDQLPVNHLICMGSGELAARVRIDLFADTSGNVSQSQSITGEDVRELYYDDNNSEYDDLMKNGKKKLKELQDTSTIDITVNDDTFEAEIDDIIGGHDYSTGINVSSAITKKVIKVEDESISITYTCGTDSGHINLSESSEHMDISEISESASVAQALAKTKNRVFHSQPTPPYDVGDLWVQGSTGDILVCKTAKES